MVAFLSSRYCLDRFLLVVILITGMCSDYLCAQQSEGAVPSVMKDPAVSPQKAVKITQVPTKNLFATRKLWIKLVGRIFEISK